MRLQNLIRSIQPVVAVVLASGAAVAFGQTVLVSDDFNDRTLGVPDVPFSGGFSDWGTANNALGGTLNLQYIVNTPQNEDGSGGNANQQTVGGGVGQIRFGRTILDYNFATDASVLAAGGFSVEYKVNPSDRGGAGFSGRDWAGVALVDTNSLIRIGGNGALINFGNDNLRLGLMPRNSGSLLIRSNNSTDVDLPSTAGPNTPNDDDASEYRRVVGNPLGAFNEPVFDSATHAAYVAAMGGNPNFTGAFTSDVFYTVRMEITSSEFGVRNGAALARIFIDGNEIDLDDTTPGVQGTQFRFGNEPAVSGIEPRIYPANNPELPYQGGLYLAFIGNGDTHLFDDLIVTTLTPAGPIAWNSDADGNWSAGSNWSTGSAPSAGGDAILGNAITADRTITLDTAVQLASLSVENTNNSAYTLDLNGGPNLDIDSLSISSGTLRLDDSVGSNAARVKAVSIASGQKLELDGALLIVDYTGTSPLAGLIAAATAGELTSTGPALGIVEASELSISSFGNVAVDADSVLIRRTLGGDTNLDGSIDFADLLNLARSFNQAGTWADGDSDYSGTIDFSDLLTVAKNFGAALLLDGTIAVDPAAAADFESQWALARVVVPEPMTAALLATVGVAGLRRRR